jgi:hypothetical protein
VNIPRVDPFDSSEPDGLTRRTMVGAGATGLALALLARSYSQAAAQDATPAAAGGMPPGVSAEPLTNTPIPAADVPAGGFTLSINRITFEAGAGVPISSYPYPTAAYIESGTLTCPGAAGRFIIAADGTMREIGEGDFPVETGETIYHPPNVLDGARNDGTESMSILDIGLVPIEGMATPSS